MGTRKRRTISVLTALVVLIFTARLLAPRYILRYVNGVLADLDGYSGHVDDVELSIWRGAYQIRGVTVEKVHGRSRMPLFKSPVIDLSVQWKALLDGAIVAEIEVTEPEINIVAEKAKEKAPPKDKGEVAETWQSKVKQLVPLDINQLIIDSGEVHFRDFNRTPKVNIFVQRIQGRVTNLTNSESISAKGDLVARARFTGTAMRSGRFVIDARIDPYSDKPTFSMAASLERLQVRQLNDFLKAYANLDAEAGVFSVYTEIRCKKGRFDGYVKPFLKDMQVFNWHDDDEGLIRKLWEGVAQVATNLLENRTTDQVATRMPLHGRLEDPNADIWTTVVQVLRNAFIEALWRGLEGNVKNAAHASKD